MRLKEEHLKWPLQSPISIPRTPAPIVSGTFNRLSFMTRGCNKTDKTNANEKGIRKILAK